MSSNALKDAPKTSAKVADLITPNWRQHAKSIQKYGTVVKDLPIGLEAAARQEIVGRLNVLLADTITLRDLYKKSHWQVGGPTFYQLHLLFDKHAGEQSELIDEIAERVQILGGVSIAMAHDVAATTRIERVPIDREEVPVQISRLLEAHHLILKDARDLAEKANDLGDVGTNDLLASSVVRTNEMQVWFVGEHLVEMPLVLAR
ncbi:MAG: DNA starvation/stationary phase protection protein [Acidobacteriaceae bacterium]